MHQIDAPFYRDHGTKDKFCRTIYRKHRSTNEKDGTFYRKDGSLNTKDGRCYSRHGSMDAKHSWLYYAHEGDTSKKPFIPEKMGIYAFKFSSHRFMQCRLVNPLAERSRSERGATHRCHRQRWWLGAPTVARYRPKAGNPAGNDFPEFIVGRLIALGE
ncbi:hypothetical protein [Methylococcus sp. EFPC2]|uniref:hypothetical protein n=1 Tax=Methylococcus sp. EFPC2 TaxID=2812648 RepID=UPI0019672941|nr:hypothetical protein [Methylococcus sp. EFPC2]QSA96814.1 hypothetical protein JWZ97_16645 [Methylococcus sp. EFPC2]